MFLKTKNQTTFFISDDVYPQTIDVVKQRAEMFGFDIVVAPAAKLQITIFLVQLIQYPGATGEVADISELNR